jgi:trk system potassium uptake protein TrkA
VNPAWIGRPLRAIEEATGARVAYVLRYGDGILPTPGGVLQENDLLHILVRSVDSDAVERTLTRAPEAS